MVMLLMLIYPEQALQSKHEASPFDQPSNEDDVEAGDKNRRRGTKHDLTPGSKQNPN